MAELMESFCCLITSIVNFRRLSCSWLCDITLTACDRVKERGKDGNLSAGHGWRWTPVKAGDEKREREWWRSEGFLRADIRRGAKFSPFSNQCSIRIGFNASEI